MLTRSQAAYGKLASLPGWLWGQRHERVVRNGYLSIFGWLVMYGVFIVEVSHLNWSSQQAKLTISPLGAPLGLTIQWLVFRDRIAVAEADAGVWAKPKQIWLTTYRTTRNIGVRWWLVKAVSFGVNQYVYALMLHRLGLPYLLAYPAAAASLGLIYYRMNNLWVFVDSWWEGPVIGYLCYHANKMWLAWTLGPVRRTATA
jgi:hypothetical protein